MNSSICHTIIMNHILHYKLRDKLFGRANSRDLTLNSSQPNYKSLIGFDRDICINCTLSIQAC
jgi:hypothetical protein